MISEKGWNINMKEYQMQEMEVPEEESIMIVVDMQNDFIDGALGTGEAQAIVPKINEKIAGFEGLVLFTQDTHDEDYLETQEGKNLPVKHCICGTKGWEIHPTLAKWIEREEYVIQKSTFGSPGLASLLNRVSMETRVKSIVLVGVCTDICVISNAMLLKSFMPEIPVIVDASCCAGVTPESHENALQAMKMCQIVVEGL